MAYSTASALDLAPPAAAAPHIAVDNVSVDFRAGKTRQRVLHNVSLTVKQGGFVSLIGPSGCGKSTLLKVLSGLLAPTEGRVTVAGMTPQQAAQRRQIGLVFQEATLLPWKNALDNAGFLLDVAGQHASAAVQERAMEMLRVVGLEHAARKRPDQLSGGMRQRVAIARALALDPEVLMMDEPFGALDAITRGEMSDFLLGLWERTGKTIVLVTHSIEEAVFLSGEVHVMATNPARIIETLPVTVPYPRNEDSFADPAFGRISARLRKLLIQSHAQGRCP